MFNDITFDFFIGSWRLDKNDQTGDLYLLLEETVRNQANNQLENLYPDDCARCNLVHVLAIDQNSECFLCKEKIFMAKSDA